jgi:phage baseplate assembly protein W
MPLQRVNSGFKDISMSFQSNPLNGDLIALKNENAIARSIRNIVFTLPGEKFFNENFGSRISRSLFDIIDPLSAISIREEIEYSINNYESRVSIVTLEVTPDYDNSSYDVLLIYNIKGAEIAPQQLEFVLQSTRSMALSNFTNLDF